MTPAMRVTLCNEVVRDLDFAEQCRFAAQTGYDGLEIAPFTLAEEPHRLSPDRRAALRRTAEEEGAAVTGLHWLLLTPKGLSITTRDTEVFARTLDIGRGLVNLCADLGGTYLVHGSPDQRQLETGYEAEGRRQALAFLEEMARAAESAGVTYVIEPLSRNQTNFVTSVAEAAEIVRATASPGLRTMIDCSAAAQDEEESIPDLFRHWLASGLLAHVHFNDPNRRGPGEGDLKFAPIVKALKQCGYRGFIGIEPFVYRPDGPACAARAIGYVRALMEAAA